MHVFAGKSSFKFTGISPFYSFAGFYKSVQLIIEKGANVNAVDDGKKSALVYAAQKGKFH